MLTQSNTNEAGTRTQPTLLCCPDLVSPPTTPAAVDEAQHASSCKNAACRTPGGVVAMSSLHSWSPAASQVSLLYSEQDSVMTVTPLQLALYWQPKKKNLL